MPQGRLILEQAVEPSRALAVGAALCDVVGPELPVVLYGAVLQGEARVLGRFQRASQVLPQDALAQGNVLRRTSGGSAVDAGDGISYVALALADRSALMSCPAQRLLNRNVRGALQGLRLAGVPANYFGRDFVSFEARPAVYVAWDADESGRVLLEFFINETRSCWPPASELAYPPRTDDVLRGREPTTLQEAGAHAVGLGALETFAQGYAKGFATEWQRASPDSLQVTVAAPLSPQDELPDIALGWSYPLEEAIGFVSAGVALDEGGKFSAVRLCGDFFAHRSCASALERQLLGVTPTQETVGRAVDGAYATSGYDVEGIRSMRTIQEAILQAVAVARREDER